MKSAIEGILYGTWGKGDYIPRSADLSAQSNKVAERERKLEELIKEKPEAIKIFKTLLEECEEQTCLEVRDYYKAGFRNGIELMIDVFSGK